MPFQTFLDNFTRADGSPGNYWAELEAGTPTSAAINSNKLRIPTGAANSSRQRVLGRPSDETVSNQRHRAKFTMGTAASQFASVWCKVNTSLRKGIRAFVLGNQLVIHKTLTTGAASTPKANTASITVTTGTDYVLEIGNVGNVYTATLYQSDGTTVVGTCTWTDIDADAADFTAAWPVGLSAQEQTDFDDAQVFNDATVTFSASQRTQHSTPRLYKGQTEPFVCPIEITRVGGDTSNISSITVSNLAANVSSTVDVPGTTNAGKVNLSAGAAAATDTTGFTARVSLFNGTDHYVLNMTVRVHAPGLAADIIQYVHGGTSSHQNAGLYGGLGTKLTNRHAAPNAKTFPHSAVYNVAVAGTNLNHWDVGSSQANQLATLINTCRQYGVGYALFTILSNQVTQAFSTFEARFDACLDNLIGQGISPILTPYAMRFEGETTYATSTISSVSDRTFGITGYTFSGADVGRWLLIEKVNGGQNYAYSQIESVVLETFSPAPAVPLNPCSGPNILVT